MGLGLHWGSLERPEDPSGFIYIDAVTAYTQDYKGQVTKHPVDAGASITDHFIKENPIFSLSGVISGVDISPIPSMIRDFEGRQPNNANPQPEPVNINSGTSGLLQFLPDSIGQFLNLGNPIAEVPGNGLRNDFTDDVRDALVSILEGVKFNSKTNRFDSFIQTVEIYEFVGTNIKSITFDLVMTNFKIREDVNTGEGLYFDCTLEQVTFATLEKTVLPQDVQQSLKKKAVGTSNKGKVDSTSKDVGSDEADAPNTDDVSLAKQIGGDLSELLPQ